MLSAPMPPTSSSAMETESTGSPVGGAAGVLELLEERHVAVAVEGVEHASGLAALTLLTIVLKSVCAERRVLLADDRHAVGRRVAP